MRHYLFPVYGFVHPKGGDPYPIGVVNRKRGMPDRGWRHEGALSFFGGGAESGEDRLTALRRELGEELPGLDLTGLEESPVLTSPPAGAAFSFTLTALCSGAWSQAEYRRLAAMCTEGVLDWVAWRPERVWGPDTMAAAGMFDSNYKHITGPEWAQERHPWVDSRMSAMAAELFQRCAPR